MNWKNVDLNNDYEREQNILDPLSFDILLLEVSCNVKEINTESVRKQFEETLKSKIESAREVFENNLNNIVKTAQQEREK